MCVRRSCLRSDHPVTALIMPLWFAWAAYVSYVDIGFRRCQHREWSKGSICSLVRPRRISRASDSEERKLVWKFFRGEDADHFGPALLVRVLRSPASERCGDSIPRYMWQPGLFPPARCDGAHAAGRIFCACIGARRMGTVELWVSALVGETGYWDTRCFGQEARDRVMRHGESRWLLERSLR